MKRISIDFNGVLDMYCGWEGRDKWYPPRPGAQEFLEKLKDKGYEVVIYTARGGPIKHIWQWLDDFGMGHLVDTVTREKLPSFAYVDDRGITFKGDFEDTLKELENFSAHWEEDDNLEWPGKPRK